MNIGIISKKCCSIILVLSMLFISMPINNIIAFASENTETVTTSEEIIDIENMDTIDEVGLTISQETLPVFLEYYPEYFFDNETYEKLLSDSYYSCAEAITSYSTLETGGLAILESIANGEKIIFKSIASTLFGTQSIEDEWTEKNVTNLMQELCSMDTIIKDSWKKTNDTFKVFKTVIDSGTNITKVVECVKKCDDSLSNEAIEKILKEAIKREFDRVPDDLKVMDWIEPVMSTFVGAWFLCQVEETIVEELLSEINQDSSLYEALSALKADMEGDQEKYIVKKIADATLYKAVKDLMKETFEVVYDGISKTYKFLPKLSFMKVQSSTIKTAISIFYNYLYQGAKISELHGAIQTQDFLNTIQSVYLNKKTELMRNAINGTLTDNIINEFVFYFNAHRCARIQYISACAEIAKTDELKETLNKQLAEVKKYTIEEYLVLCNNSIPGIDKFIYYTNSSGEPIIYGYNGEETHIEFPACLNGRVIKEIGSNYIADQGKYINQYTAIESVVIPDTVEKIGSHSFFNCSSLTNVTVPDSVTSIGSSAFSGCSSLTSITIGKGVTSIAEEAFLDCSSLKNVYITDIAKWCEIDFSGGYSNPLYYGAKLYLNNELVTNLTIPDSVTSIGDWAFSGCSSLTSITIPDSVTSIGDWAFRGCSSLTSITLPDSVTSIGYGAFYGCSSLTSITIPDSVTSIGGHAFRECSSLTNVTVPDSVTSIGSSAFSGCSSLISITLPFVGSTRGGSPNTHFGYIFGAPSSSYNSDYVPNSLKTVILTDSVTSIGSSAFSGCSSLTSITIPDSVTSIGKRSFSGCSSLTSITIPDSVTNIGDYAFGWCSSLTNVTIGNNVTSIGIGTFSSCSSLTNVTIGNSITSIGREAFCECSSLISITIPDSVISIDCIAFYGCSALTSVTIGNSITSIAEEAFHNCISLKNVYITDIAKWCEIDFSGGYSNPLYYGAKLYLNNELVTNLTIPDSVTNIGDYAFSGCSSLTNVTIPDSVTSIGSSAFSGCSSLKKVYYGGTQTQKESITIGSNNDPLINATWHYNCIPISYNGKEENVQWDDENKPILPKGYTDEQNKHFAIIGWTDKDGNKIDTSTLTVDNMVPLTAVVAEIPVDPTMLEADLIPTNDPYLPTGNKYINGFYVQGTQIRVPSDDENIKMGLRFVNILDNNLLSALKEGATDVSYGTLVMLKKYHNGGEVTLDTQNAAKVEGTNTFKYASEFNNQYLKYTVAVTGINEEYFTEKFIIRPYISFTYNGNVVTLYGEQYEGASLYSAAKLAVAPNSIEKPSAKSWIQENIVNVVEKIGDNDVPSDDIFVK